MSQQWGGQTKNYELYELLVSTNQVKQSANYPVGKDICSR
jgi:hypothetical protein